MRTLTTALLILAASGTASAQEPSAREAITRLYGTVPDLLAARACGFRDRTWFDKQVSRIHADSQAIASRSLPAFDNDASAADEFIRGAQDQALADAAAEHNRFRQQACDALKAGGRLATLDALLK